MDECVKIMKTVEPMRNQSRCQLMKSKIKGEFGDLNKSTKFSMKNGQSKSAN